MFSGCHAMSESDQRGSKPGQRCDGRKGLFLAHRVSTGDNLLCFD